MRLSTTPTDLVFARVLTTSDWDNCDLAVIELNAAYLNTIRERQKIAMTFKDEPGFKSLEFWDCNQEFLTWDEDQMTEEMHEIREYLEENDSCFVTLDEDEVFDKAVFRFPEQTIDSRHIRFMSDGSIKYIGYGKHTSEEFWTGDIVL